MDTLLIEVCMGSSCFSRGNNQAVEVIQRYCAAQEDLSARIEMRGSLCTGGCTNGPHLAINGVRYDNVNASTVLDILAHVQGAQA